MASLAISAAGAVVGGMIGGPVGAEIGWTAGALVANILFPQKAAGPQLADREVHLTGYGNAIPITYGTTREQGTYLWCSPLQEHSHTQSAKGGPQATTYTYTVDCAVLICAGPMAGILRIWANKRLIYDASAAGGNVIYDPVIGALRIYLGTETQTPDPLLVAATGTHPAYRGCCYVVFENLDCSTHFGNRPPLIEAEVATAGTSVLPPPLVLLDVSATYAGAVMTAPVRDTATGLIWTAVREGTSPGPYAWFMYAYNEATGTLVRIPFPVTPGGSTMSLALVASTREIWCVWESYPYGGPFVAIFSADALVATGTITLPGSMSGWTGEICYDADADRVLIGMTNIGNLVYVFEPATRMLDGSVGAGSGTGILIPMPGTGMVARWWSSTTTVYFLRYTGVGPAGYAVAGSASVTDYLGGFAYDSLRRRLVYFPNPAWSTDPIQVIDPVTLSVTNHANPGVGAGQGTVIYHVQNDCFYGVGDPVDNTLWAVDPVTFTLTFSTMYGSASGNLGYLLEVPGVKTYLFDEGGYFTSQFRRLFLAPVVSAHGVPLSAIVSDICTRASLSSGDINVSSLTDQVAGYSLRQIMTGRAAIEPLMQAYFFDAVESDDTLKFVKRGGAIAVVIPEDDLAAHDHTAQMPDQLLLTRAQELDLPLEVTIRYVDAAFDYQTSAQYARRLASPAKSKVDVALAISLSATQARTIAGITLYELWMGRVVAALALSTKYATLEPTDLIQATKAGHTYTLRLTDKAEAGGIYTFNAVLDDASLYAGDVSGLSIPGALSSAPGGAVAVNSPSALVLLDIPLLRDQDDGIGFYAAAGSYAAGAWPGAQLYKSTDGGYSWLAYGAPFFTETLMGSAASVLGSFTGGTIFDETNTLVVTLNNAGGVLTSTTELNVLNGQNGALIGNELIQFKNATLTAPGKYTLSGLLRGRRGTEWAMGAHVVGERFVLLTTALALEAAASSEWNLARLYRAVTLGATLAGAGNVPFTDTAIAQKCYAPVLLGGGRDASGNLTLNWTRRTRVYGAWNDGADVPLGETSEAYVINIYSSSSYATVKRTLTATSPTVGYSAANQVADFGSLQTAVYWAVAQVSATTGNGTFAQGTT